MSCLTPASDSELGVKAPVSSSAVVQRVCRVLSLLTLRNNRVLELRGHAEEEPCWWALGAWRCTRPPPPTNLGRLLLAPTLRDERWVTKSNYREQKQKWGNSFIGLVLVDGWIREAVCRRRPRDECRCVPYRPVSYDRLLVLHSFLTVGRKHMPKLAPWVPGYFVLYPELFEWINKSMDENKKKQIQQSANRWPHGYDDDDDPLLTHIRPFFLVMQIREGCEHRSYDSFLGGGWFKFWRNQWQMTFCFFFPFPPSTVCPIILFILSHRVCILSNESTQTRLVSREYRGIFTRTGALPYAQCLMHDKLQDDCQSANPTSSPFLDTSVLVGLRQIPSAVFFYFSGIYTHTHTNIIIIDR